MRLVWFLLNQLLICLVLIFFLKFLKIGVIIVSYEQDRGMFDRGFPSGLAVRNPPAVQETQEIWIWPLGWEDPLEEKMATHYSILAWKIPWTKKPGRLQSIGSQRVRHNWAHRNDMHDKNEIRYNTITISLNSKINITK